MKTETMDEVDEIDLIAQGFQADIEPGCYYLLGWHPQPTVRFEPANIFGEAVIFKTAFIGSQQWRLKCRSDLDKFIAKAIPTFCEHK